MQQQIYDLFPLTVLKQKTNALTGKIEIEKKRLSALIYNQYISGKFESIQFLLTHEDPNEIARQFQYLQFVSEARTKLIRSLRQNVAEINQVNRQIEEKHDQLKKLETKEKQEKSKL